MSLIGEPLQLSDEVEAVQAERSCGCQDAT